MITRDIEAKVDDLQKQVNDIKESIQQINVALTNLSLLLNRPQQRVTFQSAAKIKCDPESMGSILSGLKPTTPTI